MPDDVRQAYNREKARRGEKNKAGIKSLTDIVDMSPEMKALYERALENVEEKFASSKPSKELPGTEDLYRQSAPDNMKHLPSDESIYHPSQPAIDPAKSTIEPESGLQRLISSILWALLLVAAAFIVMRFLL